jgi:hypothetical protein
MTELRYFSDIVSLRARIAEIDARRETLRRVHIVALLQATARQCERTMRGDGPGERFFKPMGGVR